MIVLSDVIKNLRAAAAFSRRRQLEIVSNNAKVRDMRKTDEIILDVFDMRKNLLDKNARSGATSDDDIEMRSALKAVFQAIALIPNCRPIGDRCVALFWVLSGKFSGASDGMGQFQNIVDGFVQHSLSTERSLEVICRMQFARSGCTSVGEKHGREIQLREVRSLHEYYSTVKHVLNGDGSMEDVRNVAVDPTRTLQSSTPNKRESALTGAFGTSPRARVCQVHTAMQLFMLSAKWSKNKLEPRIYRDDTYEECGTKPETATSKHFAGTSAHAVPASSTLPLDTELTAPFPFDRAKEALFHEIAPHITRIQRSMLTSAILADIAHSIILNLWIVLEQLQEGKLVVMQDLVNLFSKSILRLIGRPLLTRLLAWLKANRRNPSGFVLATHSHIETALQKMYSYWPNLAIKITDENDRNEPALATLRLAWMERRFVNKVFRDPFVYEPNINAL